MKRVVNVGALALLLAFIGGFLWLRANRYEILANKDLQEFVNLKRHELYTYYPHLIDKLAQNPEASALVHKIHLSASGFESSEYEGRDFSGLARLPNLQTVAFTYSHNMDSFVPTLNSIPRLDSLDLLYCDPIAPIFESLDSDSLRSITIHSYKTITINEDLKEAFVQRMPDCDITFTTD